MHLILDKLWGSDTLQGRGFWYILHNLFIATSGVFLYNIIGGGMCRVPHFLNQFEFFK